MESIATCIVPLCMCIRNFEVFRLSPGSRTAGGSTASTRGPRQIVPFETLIGWCFRCLVKVGTAHEFQGCHCQELMSVLDAIISVAQENTKTP